MSNNQNDEIRNISEKLDNMLASTSAMIDECQALVKKTYEILDHDNVSAN